MPKNGKAKMHNKLMKSKEVFKSAAPVGKFKSAVSSQQNRAMKPIDLRLLQMKEREMSKSKANVAGKAAPAVKKIELQPSMLSINTEKSSELNPLSSLADILLQGEGNVKPLSVQGNLEGLVPVESVDYITARKNMFDELSDDDDDHTSKYQLKLQPSLLSLPPSVRNEVPKG
jgi:hypothetical protein